MGTKAIFDGLFSPIKRQMTNQVGKKFAAQHNRAQNRSLMQQADFHDNFGAKVHNIKMYLNEGSGEALWLKERFLNFAQGSTDDLAQARAFIRQKWGKQQLKDFDLYMKKTEDWTSRFNKAVDTTALMAFKDDIVIRVRSNAQGTLIDLRSVSRVGISDLGANARRIRAFQQHLLEQ